VTIEAAGSEMHATWYNCLIGNARVNRADLKLGPARLVAKPVIHSNQAHIFRFE